MASKRLMLALLLPLLGACNMAISEQPLFADIDKASIAPRDGIWVSNDPECGFDLSLPEQKWPSCAMWAVVENSTGKFLLQNGKGEAQRGQIMIAKGRPPIVQVLWRDEAKEDGKTFYVFFGLDSGPVQADGRFVSAKTWEVKCGTKEPAGSDIEPYPGISPECRPSSQDAVRSAANSSRSSAEMAMRWRWLRPAKR